MLDIYTLTEISNRSGEHIIPNFLGGRLQSYELIDRSTNSRFGSTIDAALDAALLSFRAIMDARSSREPHTVAPSLHKMPGSDGQIYDVHAGGQVGVPPKVQVSESHGKLEVSGTVENEQQLRQALRKKAKSKGIDLDRLVDQLVKDATHHWEAPPAITFPADLWNHDAYRAIAKLACNLFALHRRAEFLRDDFDVIRDFILNGSHPANPLIQPADIDIRSGGLGPLDHLVRVDVGDDGAVRGIVTACLMRVVC